MKIIANSLMVMTQRTNFRMYHTDTHKNFLPKGKISGLLADLVLK